MFKELGPQSEEILLTVATRFTEVELYLEHDNTSTNIPLRWENEEEIRIPYLTPRSFSLTIQIDNQEVQNWKNTYTRDPHFIQVLKGRKKDGDANLTFQ